MLLGGFLHGAYVNTSRYRSATLRQMLYPANAASMGGTYQLQIVEVAMSGTIGTGRMGPVSNVICELSNRFASRGHEVIMADVRGDRVPRPFLDPRVRVLEVDADSKSRASRAYQNRALGLLERWRNCVRFTRELSKNLDLSRADVVHFHAPMPAFLARRFHGVGAVFYTAHSPNRSLSPFAPFSRIGRFMTWVERDVIRNSRMSVGLGSYLVDAVPGANIVIIPNGLDLDLWPAMSRTEARQALGVGVGDFVVVFAGRILSVKGIDTFLDAIRSVRTELRDLRAYLIGPLSGSFDTRDEFVHPFARRMLDLAHGLPTKFLGFISNREQRFRQYLAAADVFVLPSRSEPQGLVVLEALAMGTPVIGSMTGGIPDMISSDVGYLFEPGNAAALATCIREAHDQRESLRRKQAAARVRVQMHYSWDSVVDRYLSGFELALSEDGLSKDRRQREGPVWKRAGSGPMKQ